MITEGVLWEQISWTRVECRVKSELTSFQHVAENGRRERKQQIERTEE